MMKMMKSFAIVILLVQFGSLTAGGKISKRSIPAQNDHTNGTSPDKEIVVCNQYIGQDPNTNDAIKKLDEKLERLISLVQNQSAENQGPFFSSCKDIYNDHRSQGNKAYMLQMSSGKVYVYCHMSSMGLGACGGGGWTLVMKTDGHKPTFHFKSNLWSNQVDFNLPGGKTGFDTQETKLPTYWNTPFSKICLGMRWGNQLNFVMVTQRANSLYSLIADGVYRKTSLGRNTWKTLIGAQASLQLNCNMEGFNAQCGSPKARIGILGNEYSVCTSCDSRLGFGTGGDRDDSNTCGNEAAATPDNGDKHIKAMGYIFVQ